MRLIRQLLLWGIFILAVSFISFAAWVTIPLLSDPEPGFISRKGSIKFVEEEGVASFTGMDYLNITLHSTSGLKVRMAVRKPGMQHKPLPLVVLLGGHRTGRDAVRLINTNKPVVVAAVSYPHSADPRASGLAVIPGIREYARAFRDITPAVLLVLDYLTAQDYVDPKKVELAGISLGAFLVSMPGALDDRVRRVWLIHGAGDPPRVIAHLLRHKIKNDFLRYMTANILSVLASAKYVQAEKWVGRIAPRRLVVVNAREDEFLPADAIRALHDVLPEHVEVIWTEGVHVTPGRKEVINRLTKIVFQRVAAD